MKKKHIQWLIPAVLLLAIGCSVDVNEGMGGGDDMPPDPECPAAELSTVRFMHAAGGTPVTRRPGVTSTRNLNVVRADMMNATVTSLAAGRASLVRLCGNKQLMLGARLAGATANRVTMMVTLTPDPPMVSPLDAARTIILAGISDALKSDGTPENPASMANPLRFIDVPDAFTGPDTQIQVVHASRRTPTPVNVEAHPDSAGPEIMALDRYAASAVATTKGSSDMAPATVPVVFLENVTARSTHTIAPRIPAGAKVLAIHFDTEIFDPDNPDGMVNPPPVARLFVTGDDPLLGGVAGGGVQF